MAHEMNYFTKEEVKRMENAEAGVQRQQQEAEETRQLFHGVSRQFAMVLWGVAVVALVALVVLLSMSMAGKGSKQNGEQNPGMGLEMAADQDAQSQEVLPQQDPEEEQAQMQESQEIQGPNVTAEDWFVVLAGPGTPLPDGFEPETAVINDAGFEMDARVVEAFQAMDAAARQAGIQMQVISGYRGPERQQSLYEQELSNAESQGLAGAEAEQAAQRIEQKAYESDHNTGLGVDLLPEDDLHKNQNSISESREFAWLQQNAADYGFVLRYPEDKQDITGVEFKPWHWRYVGIELAQFMVENNLTLEEYWQQYLS